MGRNNTNIIGSTLAPASRKRRITSPHKSARQVLHHQQRQAAQAQAGPEHVGDQISAQEGVELKEATDDAGNGAHNAYDQRAALPARGLGRARDKFICTDLQAISAHCGVLALPRTQRRLAVELAGWPWLAAWVS